MSPQKPMPFLLSATQLENNFLTIAAILAAIKSYWAKSTITEKRFLGNILGMKYVNSQNFRNEQFQATFFYNSFVIGVHNYYDMATHVQKDFRKIAFPIHKSLKVRLRDRLKTKKQLEQKKIKSTIPKHIQEAYGKSQQLRFVGNDKVLVPIEYVSHKNPIATTVRHGI